VVHMMKNDESKTKAFPVQKMIDWDQNHQRIAARSTDPSTSKEAATKFGAARGSQRFKLLAEFCKAEQPLSDEEAAFKAGLTTGHKRCAELRKAGLIQVVGKKTGPSGCKVRTCTPTSQGLREWVINTGGHER
jgi:hypothetical protein